MLAIAEAGPDATAIAFGTHTAYRRSVLAEYLENLISEPPAEFGNPAHTFKQLAHLDLALSKLETAVGHGRG